MEQAGSQDIAGSRAHVPGYTLDRGISVDRAGAVVEAHDNATGSPVTIRLLSPALTADPAFRRQLRHDMGVLVALRHQRIAANPPAQASAITGFDVDPVCGMTVDINDATYVADHNGRTYHFCCAACQERFVAEPERFLRAPAG